MTVYQVERFEACLDELRPLHRIHWEETEEDRHAVGFNPNYDYYLQVERMGMLHLVTARDGGRLVGDYCFFLSEHRHSKHSITAHLDSMFVLPEYRRGLDAVRMLRYAEQTLRDRGVGRIVLACKVAHDVSPIFKRCGYQHTEVVFTKTMEERNA